jgi:hypothetical protein
MAAILAPPSNLKAERCLLALQYDDLRLLDDTDPDASIKFENALHAREFNTHASGFHFEATASTPPAAGDKQDLDKLNCMLKKYYRNNAAYYGYGTRVYNAWYKYVTNFEDPWDPHNPKLLDDVTEGIAKLKNMADENRALRDTITALQSQVSQNMQITSVPDKPFYTSTEPTLLVEGAGFQKPEEFDVYPRREGAITALGDYNDVSRALAIPDLRRFNIPDRISNSVIDIICETVLMSECFNTFIKEKIAHTSEDISEILSNLRNGADNKPQGFSLNPFSPPWKPILIEYDVSLGAFHTVIDSDNTFSQFTFGAANTDLTPNTGAKSGKTCKFKGMSLVSPHAINNLSRNLKSYSKQYNNVEIPQLLSDKLESADYVTQCLYGLNDFLISQKEQMNTKIVKPDSPDAALDGIVADLNQLLDLSQITAPLLCSDTEYFISLRGIEIDFAKTNIWLVDSFGQHICFNGIKPVVSEQLKFNANALLPPRFAVPLRLNFEWNETNLIFGFIMPNFIDNDIQIYTETGDFVGIIRQNQWLVRRIEPDTLNSQLRSFITAQLNGGTLEVLLNYLEKRFNRSAAYDINPLQTECFGKPLALVNASLRAESMSDIMPVAPLWEDTIDITHDNHFQSAKFDVMIGDPRCNSDSVAAFYTGENYSDLHESAAAVQLSLDSGVMPIALMCEVKGSVYIQSGLLPVLSVPFVTRECAGIVDNFMIMLNVSPVLGKTDNLKLDVPQDNTAWTFAYKDTDGSDKSTQKIQIPDLMLASLPDVLEGFIEQRRS